MILVIDNYDSFTYNLVHMVAASDPDVDVVRNDRIDVDGIRQRRPDGLLISPGPGRPEDAGVTKDAIRMLGPTLPVLGVCLGHQAIGEVYGGTVGYAPSLMHGKTSAIHHDGSGIFEQVEQDFTATRYHSLVVEEAGLPDTLTVTARTADGIIMGLRHRDHPVVGIQFHPESLLTAAGPRLIANWIAQTKRRTA